MVYITSSSIYSVSSYILVKTCETAYFIVVPEPGLLKISAHSVLCCFLSKLINGGRFDEAQCYVHKDVGMCFISFDFSVLFLLLLLSVDRLMSTKEPREFRERERLFSVFERLPSSGPSLVFE